MIMAALVVLFAFVAVGLLSFFFGVDSRTGVNDHRQPWFGRL